MLKLFNSAREFLGARQFTASSDSKIASAVSQIIDRVRQDGDQALMKFTEKYDGVNLSELRVPVRQIERAESGLCSDFKEIIEAAIKKIRRFHQCQSPESWFKEMDGGGKLGMRFRSIENVGIYIPGGTAGYPSTVIMTVVPAKIAGVKRIVLTSPPGKDGSVNPLVLAAAGRLGVTEIYAVGGAQAVAAFAYGTETIPKVDKIVGPGNAYVNEAKRQVFGIVGIDALAGPTEVVILADEHANPDYVIRDMFAQAEHDTDARAILVTTSKKLARTIQENARSLVQNAPRLDILKAALENVGAVVLVSNMEEGVKLANEIAPEHLQIMTKSPETELQKITNAGAIFLGDFTPTAVGDYFAGPNHVLPTAGTAKFSSPLSVLDFMKFSSIVEYSKSRLQVEEAAIAKFAELEGLMSHKKSIECRNE